MPNKVPASRRPWASKLQIAYINRANRKDKVMALNYNPISSSSELKEALKQIDNNFRQIAAENQTKTIAQSGGSALQEGKLKNGTYGIVLSDPNNIPRILIGFHKNGEPIIAVTKAGKNVFDALGE